MAPSSPEDLLDLTDEDFASLVDQDLRERLDPDTAAALRSQEVLFRWRSKLEQLVEHSIIILQSKEAEAEADRIEYVLAGNAEAATACEVNNLRLRAKALRFQAIVRQRALHVDYLVARCAWNEQRKTARLIEAIQAHKTSLLDASPNAADRNLWAVLRDI